MTRTSLLLCTLTLSMALPCLAATSPMTFKELSMLLRNGEKASFIMEDASRRKLDKPLSAEEEAKLKSLGATPALLDTLRVAAGLTPAPKAAAQPIPAIESSQIPTPVWTSALVAERQKFTTQLVKNVKTGTPVETPPRGKLELVSYHSPIGDLPAYVSPPIPDGTLHPAIIWIVGGFDNGIDSTAWEPAPRDNDQSASAFAKAGIMMMYPSLRGGNNANPGYIENFYGEVDDVIAAADFLSKQRGVDPHRIYLGGHSTGGTLALLVAECTDRFRAVFSLGPVSTPTAYRGSNLNFDTTNRREVSLRSPGYWLNCIKTPTFVIEGTEKSNIEQLLGMKQRSTNPLIHFLPVDGGTHFTIIAPTTQLLAAKILADSGPNTNITLSPEELKLP